MTLDFSTWEIRTFTNPKFHKKKCEKIAKKMRKMNSQLLKSDFHIVWKKLFVVKDIINYYITQTFIVILEETHLWVRKIVLIEKRSKIFRHLHLLSIKLHFKVTFCSILCFAFMCIWRSQISSSAFLPGIVPKTRMCPRCKKPIKKSVRDFCTCEKKHVLIVKKIDVSVFVWAFSSP